MKEYVFVSAVRPIQEGRRHSTPSLKDQVVLVLVLTGNLGWGGCSDTNQRHPTPCLSGQAAAPVQQAGYMGFPAASQ